MSILLQTIPEWLLAALLYLLLRRRAYRVCPCFFAYVAFGLVAGVARVVTRNYPHPFYAAYWITEAGYDVLGIVVMHELIRTVLRNLTSIWWGRFIFPAILVAGVSLSLARAYTAPPRFDSHLAVYIVVGEIAVRFIQVLAVLLTLIPLFGRPGHRYPLGIAAGFGFYSIVALLSTTRLSDKGTRFFFLWGVILLAAYSVAELIWIWTFAGTQWVRLPEARPEADCHHDSLPPAEESDTGFMLLPRLHRRSV
ncbi:MAG TPA: hypothetical protein VN950_13210 [Terriglobales bacterium]|nr:hypothetical protein [Terriglobales bacterium]